MLAILRAPPQQLERDMNSTGIDLAFQEYGFKPEVVRIISKSVSLAGWCCGEFSTSILHVRVCSSTTHTHTHTRARARTHSMAGTGQRDFCWLLLHKLQNSRGSRAGTGEAQRRADPKYKARESLETRGVYVCARMWICFSCSSVTCFLGGGDLLLCLCSDGCFTSTGQASKPRKQQSHNGDQRSKQMHGFLFTPAHTCIRACTHRFAHIHSRTHTHSHTITHARIHTHTHTQPWVSSSAVHSVYIGHLPIQIDSYQLVVSLRAHVCAWLMDRRCICLESRVAYTCILD